MIAMLEQFVLSIHHELRKIPSITKIHLRDGDLAAFGFLRLGNDNAEDAVLH